MPRVPDDEVGHVTGFKLPVGFSAPKRPRRMTGDTGPCFFRGQAKLNAGHIHRQMQTGKGAGAGVVICRDGHRDALLSQLFNRRALALWRK